MNKVLKWAIAIPVAVVVYLLVVYYTGWFPAHWKPFSPPDGAYTIMMPGDPSPEDIATSGTNVRAFSVTYRSSAFLCSYFDLPPNTQAADVILDGARDGSIRNVQGRLISEQKMTMDGHPVRQFKATARNNSFVEERMHLVGQRIYLLMVVHQDENDGDVARFFDSFKINH